jgi:hypothetical protein
MSRWFAHIGLVFCLLGGLAQNAAAQDTLDLWPSYLLHVAFRDGIRVEAYVKHPTPWGSLFYTTRDQNLVPQVERAVEIAQAYLDAQFSTSLSAEPLEIYIVPKWDSPNTGGTTDPNHCILISGGNSHLSHTAMHELAHVYQLRTSGVPYAQFLDYGDENPWLAEGLADAVAYNAGLSNAATRSVAEDVFRQRLQRLMQNPFRGLYSRGYNTLPFWVYIMEKKGLSAGGVTEVIASAIDSPSTRVAEALDFGQHWPAFAKGLRNKAPYEPHPWMQLVGTDEPFLFNGVVDKGLFRKHRIHLPPLSYQYAAVQMVPSCGELAVFLQALKNLEGVEVHVVIRTPGGDSQENWTNEPLKILTRTGKGLGTSAPVSDFTRVEILFINKNPRQGYFVIPPNRDVQVRAYPASEEVELDTLTAGDYPRSVVGMLGVPGGVRAQRSTLSEAWFAQLKGILQLEFKGVTHTRNFSGFLWYLLDRRLWEADGVDKEVQAQLNRNAYFQGWVDFESDWKEARVTFTPPPPQISDNLYKEDKTGQIVNPPTGTFALTLPFKFDSSEALPPTANSLYVRPDARMAIATMFGGAGAAAANAKNLTKEHAEEAKPGSLIAKLAGLFRSTISLGMDEGGEREITIKIYHHKGRALWEVPIMDHITVYYQAMR